MIEPRALFLFPDEPPQPDTQVCSGRYRDWLEGAACPYAEAGRMPLLGREREGMAGAGGGPSAPAAGAAGGQTGKPAAGSQGWVRDPASNYPCIVAQLGRLTDWRGELQLRFPPELGRLTLFKCKQMCLLVVPGEEAAR